MELTVESLHSSFFATFSPDMNLCPISILLLFAYFLIPSTIGSTSSTQFTGDVSINCGSARASAARNGRQFLGDAQPELFSLLQLTGKSTTSTATNYLILDDPVPHTTARISRSRFSYSFQVDPGQKIIRLHFNPSKYQGFRGFKHLFTVQSGSFTLLSNFSASLTAANTFATEFCLTVQGNEQLTITFYPETSRSQDTYAFVNGIEIAAVPTALSYFDSGDIGLQVVGEKSMIYVDNETALEIIERRSIKQSSYGDSDSVFPKWATQQVEKKKSSSWKIPVALGFRYLVRLHFSDVGLKIAGSGELRFKVLINDMIAQTNSDILTASNGNHLVLHRDYIVMMRGLKTDGKRDILISIQSYDELRYGHGVLAGFEIVKLSNPDNSLASLNPLPPPDQDPPSTTIRYLLSLLGHINATATVAITIASLVNITVYKLKHIWGANSTDEEIRPSDRAERLFRYFPLREIQSATENFHEGHLIGQGGFGKVYKGLIDNGKKTVAVKRLKSNSKQGVREFLTEIEALSELQHINLVPLIGYCRERKEMILVYEHMPNGTLADHLYRNARRNRNCSSLTWKQRLNICIEAGRGLDYLHTSHGFIHRDVKPSNILLDENFIAKVSDFGLAKREDRSKLQSHVSTKVKGTFGYFDPYYMTTQRLTTKSDTYAFGVVLFETLCGRPAIDSMVSNDERCLTTWVLDKISKGDANEIIDSSLREEILPNSLKTYVEVAVKCLHDVPKFRPTMSQVVQHLEFALEQQETRNPAKVDMKISSESPGQLAEAYADMQTVKYPQTKLTDLNYAPATSKDLRKPNKYNPCRAWRAFWRRDIPSDSQEICLAPANSWNYDLSDFAAAANQFSNPCRYFSLHEIKTATQDFNDDFVIGMGAFGKVYKGLIDKGATIVAIKKLNSSTLEAASELLTQIHFWSKLRHHNLVSLIGYCNEKGEMALVHNYMAHGTLRDHLYNSRNPPLTWKRRLQICVDTAKALNYLHSGAEQVIIHRDIKSVNILLDEEWVAKIHVFRLSKLHSSDSDSTTVYLDPEYFRRQQLTEKTDVYSFGVVLFEVLCARPAVDHVLTREQVNLGKWATSCFMEGKLEQIVDPNLNGQIGPKCLNKFAETAVACLSDFGVDRPTMRDVIRSLESAMQLQEIDDGNTSSSPKVYSLHLAQIQAQT